MLHHHFSHLYPCVTPIKYQKRPDFRQIFPLRLSFSQYVCLPIFPWSSHDFAMKSGQHRRSWGNFSKQRRSRLLLFPGGEDTLLQDRKMAGKYYVYPIWLTSFNRELVLDSRPLDFGGTLILDQARSELTYDGWHFRCVAPNFYVDQFRLGEFGTCILKAIRCCVVPQHFQTTSSSSWLL